MGLSFDLNTKENTGVEIICSDAYLNILNVSYNKAGSYFAYRIFKDIDSKTLAPIRENTIEFTPDLTSADNLVKQAYLHLKTLPEFVNAVDC